MGYVFWNDTESTLHITWPNGQPFQVHLVDVGLRQQVVEHLSEPRLLVGFAIRADAIVVAYRLEVYGPIQYAGFGPHTTTEALMAALAPQR